MTQKWIYKLVCLNPKCRHHLIDEFDWTICPKCGEKLIIADKWPGGR